MDAPAGEDVPRTDNKQTGPADGARTMRRGLVTTGLVLSLVTVGYALTALGLPRGRLGSAGAGWYPQLIVAPMLAIGAVGILVEARRVGGSVEWPHLAGWGRIAAVSAAALGYVLLSEALGHALSCGLMCLVVLTVFEQFRIMPRILAAAVIGVSSDILFTLALGTPLPRGPFGWYW